MEKRKKFEVLVTQLNRFSRKFVVEATNQLTAKAAVKEMIAAQPMEARKGTYDGNELIMRVKEEAQAEDAPSTWFEPTILEVDLELMIAAQPMEARKGTYDGNELIMRVKEEAQAEDAPSTWFEPTILEVDLEQ